MAENDRSRPPPGHSTWTGSRPGHPGAVPPEIRSARFPRRTAQTNPRPSASTTPAGPRRRPIGQVGLDRRCRRAPWIEERQRHRAVPRSGPDSRFATTDGRAAVNGQRLTPPIPAKSRPPRRARGPAGWSPSCTTPAEAIITPRDGVRRPSGRVWSPGGRSEEEVATGRGHPARPTHQPPRVGAPCSSGAKLRRQDQRQYRQLVGRLLGSRGKGRQAAVGDQVGRRHRHGHSRPAATSTRTRGWILRNSPVPIGTVPIYRGPRKRSTAWPKDLTWEVYRDINVDRTGRAAASTT